MQRMLHKMIPIRDFPWRGIFREFLDIDPQLLFFKFQKTLEETIFLNRLN